MQIPFMPFKILALAPFRFDDEIWTQPPVSIDSMDLDAVMDKLGISFYLPIPDDLCPAGGLDIRFSKLKDFHPDALVQNNSFLSHLLDAKSYLTGIETKNLSAQEKKQGLKQWPDLPSIQIKSEKKDSKPPLTSTVDDILSMVALPGESPGPSLKSQTESAQIDSILQQVLNHIFIHEKFRRSETAWRGLKLLLQQSAGDSDVKLEIVPVTLNTLEETLDNLTADLIHHLPSLILIDLPFDNSPFCIKLLEKISRLAEILLVPAMVWITPRFMQIDSWKDLNKLPFLPHFIEEQAFAKWCGLKVQPAANWLTITCNRFLARYPYGVENKPRNIEFYEQPLLWTAPVWAAAYLIAQTFIKTGWPTRFTDWQDIKIDDLPLDTKSAPRPIPTEASFTEDRIDQFRRSGIMPLAAMQNKDIAFVPAETTMGEASLSYQLLVSRITQFILCLRDDLPKDLEGAELEERLRQAFSLFWEKSGHAGPENLEISAGQPGPDNRIPLRITLQPSRKILPSGEKIVLEFSW
jgi:EvpB/VC_A0108, tail sheath N-terminal domain/Type VI secretion system, VipA, VC_A0107 or Hcp2